MPRIYLFLALFWSWQCCLGQNSIIADVKFQGAKRTKPAFLKQLVSVKPGMPLDSLMMDKDITRLKRLPSVSHAYYQVFSSNDGRHNVFYNVVENFTLIPFANLFSSANDDFAFRIGLQEFNLLGRNITLGGFYQYDVFSSYGISLRAPYLFGNRFGLAFNYNDFTTQEPVFLPIPPPITATITAGWNSWAFTRSILRTVLNWAGACSRKITAI